MSCASQDSSQCAAPASGAGLDPCAALQAELTLEAGDLVFWLNRLRVGVTRLAGHEGHCGMAADLTATTFTQQEYTRYIYGSAEVVGLMCLRVFVLGDEEEREF